YTPQAFTKEFSSLPLDFEPGVKFNYSNSGYFLLGVIIEKVTGKPYATVLSENILKPAQLTDTGYDLFSPILPKRAAGYEKQAGKSEINLKRHTGIICTNQYSRHKR
ncbi:MAG: class A beta-lactamase-related serine hydrolase, partial [Sphingobacteriales bacterium]